jgi:oligopeptide/dipeptide ABC transporter ATP-binding protein
VTAASGPPLLDVRNLVTHYRMARTGIRGSRPTVRALDSVSLTVGAGETVALVGESGSGKTTLAQSVTRMVEPREGTIRFRGQDITRMGPREMRPLRRQVQMIYQDPYESLDPRFRVRRSISEPLAIHEPRTARAWRAERVTEMLDLVGLHPPELYLERFPHELSGGQRQRVAIAAAMVLSPMLLIADEPVSMLDVSVRMGILTLLGALRAGGLGILMITHDLSTAAHFADRIYVMYLGRIVEEGPAARVIGDPAHPYTRALISAVPRPDPVERSAPQILAGEAPDAAHVPPGCRFHPRCPIAVPDCANRDPTLSPVGSGEHSAACIRLGMAS